AREARGLSLAQAEEETKIRRRYLAALEENRFEVLPGRVYARAFLRTYARFLGLDGEELARELQGYAPAEPRVEPKREPRYWEYRPRHLLKPQLVAFVMVVAALGGLNFLYGRATGPPPAAEAPAPAVVSAGEATGGGLPSDVPPAAPTPQGVELVVNVMTDRSWLRVVGDNTRLFEGELTAGQSRVFQAREKITLRVGNAGAVELAVNGRELGRLGRMGQVVEKDFGPEQG
ncbi:MAG: helix-turn-helix domain-containing protein, partial [Firmicutes bacterium]|nr:helix-turn-helix domain-containing protein [Bacillota bacterium]